MNTVAVKSPQNVDTNSKVMQDKIYTALETGKKQAKKLAWLFEHHPGFDEQNLFDENLGPEIRRSRW